MQEIAMTETPLIDIYDTRWTVPPPLAKESPPLVEDTGDSLRRRHYKQLQTKLAADKLLAETGPFIFTHAERVLETLRELHINPYIYYPAAIAAMIIDLPQKDREYIKELIYSDVDNVHLAIIKRIVRMRKTLEEQQSSFSQCNISRQQIYDTGKLTLLAREIGIIEIWASTPAPDKRMTSKVENEIYLLIAIAVDSLLRQKRSLVLRNYPSMIPHKTDLQYRETHAIREAEFSYNILWPLFEYIGTYYLRGTRPADVLSYMADLLFETSPTLIDPILRITAYNRFWLEYVGTTWLVERGVPKTPEEIKALVYQESAATAQELALITLEFFQETLTSERITRLRQSGTIRTDFHQQEQPYENLDRTVPEEVLAYMLSPERIIKHDLSILWKLDQNRIGDDRTQTPRIPMSENYWHELCKHHTPFDEVDGKVVVDGVATGLVFPVMGFAFFTGHFRRDAVEKRSIVPELDPIVEELFDYIEKRSDGRYKVIFTDLKHAQNPYFPWLQVTIWDTLLHRFIEFRGYPGDVREAIGESHFRYKQAWPIFIHKLSEILDRALPMFEPTTDFTTAYIEIGRQKQNPVPANIHWARSFYDAPKNLDAAIAGGPAILKAYLESGVNFQHMTGPLPTQVLTSNAEKRVRINSLTPFLATSKSKGPRIAEIIAAVNRATSDATPVMRFLMQAGQLSDLDLYLMVCQAAGIGIPQSEKLRSQASTVERFTPRLRGKIQGMLVSYFQGALTLKLINHMVRDSTDRELLMAFDAIKRQTVAQ